jgi:1-acyl-sn-glycerol-3-phosphate acyltransferase
MTEASFRKVNRGIFIYPHTSKWDAVIFGMYILAFPNLFKHTYSLFAARFFKGPLGWFLKSCNCVPIENQKRGNGQLNQLITFFSTKKNFQLFWSPKGSSESRPKWRSGYRVLAVNLQCTIVVCGLDYQEKRPNITAIFTDPQLVEEETLADKMKGIPSLYPANEPFVYAKL